MNFNEEYVVERIVREREVLPTGEVGDWKIVSSTPVNAPSTYSRIIDPFPSSSFISPVLDSPIRTSSSPQLESSRGSSTLSSSYVPLSSRSPAVISRPVVQGTDRYLDFRYDDVGPLVPPVEEPKYRLVNSQPIDRLVRYEPLIPPPQQSYPAPTYLPFVEPVRSIPSPAHATPQIAAPALAPAPAPAPAPAVEPPPQQYTFASTLFFLCDTFPLSQIRIIWGRTGARLIRHCEPSSGSCQHKRIQKHHSGRFLSEIWNRSQSALRMGQSSTRLHIEESRTIAGHFYSSSLLHSAFEASPTKRCKKICFIMDILSLPPPATACVSRRVSVADTLEPKGPGYSLPTEESAEQAPTEVTANAMGHTPLDHIRSQSDIFSTRSQQTKFEHWTAVPVSFGRWRASPAVALAPLHSPFFFSWSRCY